MTINQLKKKIRSEKLSIHEVKDILTSKEISDKEYTKLNGGSVASKAFNAIELANEERTFAERNKGAIIASLLIFIPSMFVIFLAALSSKEDTIQLQHNVIKFQPRKDTSAIKGVIMTSEERMDSNPEIPRY